MSLLREKSVRLNSAKNTSTGSMHHAPTVRHHSSMFLGMAALEVLLRARRSLGITQVASALGISKSTAHDLMAALVQLGFVEQSELTRRYAVWDYPRIVDLGRSGFSVGLVFEVNRREVAD